jgi:hypothetical protein
MKKAALILIALVVLGASAHAATPHEATICWLCALFSI